MSLKIYDYINITVCIGINIRHNICFGDVNNKRERRKVPS